MGRGVGNAKGNGRVVIPGIIPVIRMNASSFMVDRAYCEAGGTPCAFHKGFFVGWRRLQG